MTKNFFIIFTFIIIILLIHAIGNTGRYIALLFIVVANFLSMVLLPPWKFKCAYNDGREWKDINDIIENKRIPNRQKRESLRLSPCDVPTVEPDNYNSFFYIADNDDYENLKAKPIDDSNTKMVKERNRDQRAMDGVTMRDADYGAMFGHIFDKEEKRQWWGNGE